MTNAQSALYEAALAVIETAVHNKVGGGYHVGEFEFRALLRALEHAGQASPGQDSPGGGTRA